MFLSLSIYIMLYISMFHPLFLCFPMKLSKNKTGNYILHILRRKLILRLRIPTSPSPTSPSLTSPRPHVPCSRVPAHASHVPNTRPVSQSPSHRPSFSHSPTGNVRCVTVFVISIDKSVLPSNMVHDIKPMPKHC